MFFFFLNLLDCVFSNNGSEFHMDAPENVRLVLKRSMRGLGMFILIWSRVGFIGNK